MEGGVRGFLMLADAMRGPNHANQLAIAQEKPPPSTIGNPTLFTKSHTLDDRKLQHPNTLNPKPDSNAKPETRNPKPETRNPKSEARNLC